MPLTGALTDDVSGAPSTIPSGQKGIRLQITAHDSNDSIAFDQTLAIDASTLAALPQTVAAFAPFSDFAATVDPGTLPAPLVTLQAAASAQAKATQTAVATAAAAAQAALGAQQLGGAQPAQKVGP